MAGLGTTEPAADGHLAATAFACAGLFAAVSVGLGAAPNARWVEYVGLGFHGLLLPLAARLEAPGWARAAGYAWIAVDGTVSVALLAGAPPKAAMPVRLGGHVLAAVWIAASRALPAPARRLGWALAACLGGHSLAAPLTRRPVLLYAAGPLMVAWLAAVGAALRKQAPPPASA